jgi:hypothetical protein
MIIDPDTITLALATLALMVPSLYDGSLFAHTRLESRAFENSVYDDGKDILYLPLRLDKGRVPLRAKWRL